MQVSETAWYVHVLDFQLLDRYKMAIAYTSNVDL